MIALFYALVIAFGFAGGIIIRRKGLKMIQPLVSVLLIGCGIGLVLCPLIFGKNFFLFDHILENSLALPFLIAISVVSMVFFMSAALGKKTR